MLLKKPFWNSSIETEDLENKEKNITVATANPHKLKEINEINTFNNITLSIIEGDFDPEETGSTFEENAYIKAKAAAKIMNNYALADDTGLCVDALDGAPGLYSARYAETAEKRIEKLLQELKNIPEEKRTANFTCVIVLVDKNGNIIHKETGIAEGIIVETKQGTNGFGYDPVFFMPEYNLTMADMPAGLKNTVSHRAKALIPMLKWIDDNL